VPQLSGELREQVLAEWLVAAQEIEDARIRAPAMAALAQLVKSHLSPDLRLAILDLIAGCHHQERRILLQVLSTPGLITADTLGVDEATIARIARSMIDICIKWEFL